MRADYEKVMSRKNTSATFSATPGRGGSKSRLGVPSSPAFEQPNSLLDDGEDGHSMHGATEGEPRDDVQRRWFQKKIQEMQRKCEAQVRAAKRGTSSEEVQAMQKRIRSQDKELERLREELISMPSSGTDATGAGASTSTAVSVKATDATAAAAALRKAKEMHERQLLAQAEEHQATVARLRIELLAASKSLAAARSDMHDATTAAAAAAGAGAGPTPTAATQQTATNGRVEQALAVANSQVGFGLFCWVSFCWMYGNFCEHADTLF